MSKKSGLYYAKKKYDLYYAGGLFDGEGCFRIDRNNKQQSVSMT
ncbi:MAG: hypothetical protein GTO02_15945, partial [Candidatus Dadabacteria bacterium]|nr:hypothetical protein [Candidatus Dadabacteria bacterium]